VATKFGVTESLKIHIGLLVSVADIISENLNEEWGGREDI
jgi:hypothetical protein